MAPRLVNMQQWQVGPRVAIFTTEVPGGLETEMENMTTTNVNTNMTQAGLSATPGHKEAAVAEYRKY